jgi:hypothetical protein
MCDDKYEKILWSIALPGFGQILNGQLLKGILFIALEFLVNVKANINTVIFLSFQGNIALAIEQTKYQWLMFYPCIYMFSIYDAYKNSNGNKPAFAFLPFSGSAILGTIGVIYSPMFKISGIAFGPIFTTILFFILGTITGYILRRFLIKNKPPFSY